GSREGPAQHPRARPHLQGPGTVRHRGRHHPGDPQMSLSSSGDPHRDPHRNPNRDPNRDPHRDPNRDPNRDPHREPNRDPNRGPEPGSAPGSAPGSEPGPEPGSAPGTKPGPAPAHRCRGSALPPAPASPSGDRCHLVTPPAPGVGGPRGQWHRDPAAVLPWEGRGQWRSREAETGPISGQRVTLGSGWHRAAGDTGLRAILGCVFV
uniref:Uncharacterized protein n=1 Tax=Apteryx owenii TaxID=8824 RepID=A0A8B9P3M8_APTOW